LQDSSAAAAGSKRGDQQQQQDMLTHGGVSLEELDVLNARPTELLGDLDDDLLEDLVQQYHFGGGEEQQQEGEQGQAGRQRKTKKQVRGVRHPKHSVNMYRWVVLLGRSGGIVFACSSGCVCMRAEGANVGGLSSCLVMLHAAALVLVRNH
jgi:hypothetical protein